MRQNIFSVQVSSCLTGRDITVAYDGKCRGQGGEFQPPQLAASTAEEEEEICPDICQFDYKPVCGTGQHIQTIPPCAVL